MSTARHPAIAIWGSLIMGPYLLGGGVFVLRIYFRVLRLEGPGDELPPLIKKWESRLKVSSTGCFLQRMKTKWGSCNHKAGHIRLNTELVKKPKDLLEYVIVRELVHLLEPKHSERFIAILQEHYPTWR